jgi:hypothetical protein
VHAAIRSVHVFTIHPRTTLLAAVRLAAVEGLTLLPCACIAQHHLTQHHYHSKPQRRVNSDYLLACVHHARHSASASHEPSLALLCTSLQNTTTKSTYSYICTKNCFLFFQILTCSTLPKNDCHTCHAIATTATALSMPPSA